MSKSKTYIYICSFMLMDIALQARSIYSGGTDLSSSEVSGSLCQPLTFLEEAAEVS